MLFSDKITRDEYDDVFVKRSEYEFNQRESQSGTALWSIAVENIGKTEFKKPIHLYRVPASFVLIGEDIYDRTGKNIAYRSE